MTQTWELEYGCPRGHVRLALTPARMVEVLVEGYGDVRLRELVLDQGGVEMLYGLLAAARACLRAYQEAP